MPAADNHHEPSPRSQARVSGRKKALTTAMDSQTSSSKRAVGKSSKKKEKNLSTSSKRKATPDNSNFAPKTNEPKKARKQKSFHLSLDKRKPDALLMKRVAFDVTDDGYGKTLLDHFGGLSAIASSLVNGKYLFGTIARLNTVKRTGASSYIVEWGEDQQLTKATIDLPCLIPSIFSPPQMGQALLM